MYLVHSHGNGFVSLLADGTEAHGSGDKAAHDLAGRFDLFQGNRCPFLEGQEVAEEDRAGLLVDQFRVFLEFLVAARSGRQL